METPGWKSGWKSGGKSWCSGTKSGKHSCEASRNGYGVNNGLIFFLENMTLEEKRFKSWVLRRFFNNYWHRKWSNLVWSRDIESSRKIKEIYQRCFSLKTNSNLTEQAYDLSPIISCVLRNISPYTKGRTGTFSIGRLYTARFHGQNENRPPWSARKIIFPNNRKIQLDFQNKYILYILSFFSFSLSFRNFLNSESCVMSRAHLVRHGPTKTTIY